jgi:hypothetical protein
VKILILFTALFLSTASLSTAQENAAVIDHARHIRDLFVQEKFDDVFKEFNSQVAQMLSPERIRQIWMTLKQQFGEYKSEISAQPTKSESSRAVVIGCQFERAALNMAVAFDSEGKVASFQFAPRPTQNGAPKN